MTEGKATAVGCLSCLCLLVALGALAVCVGGPRYVEDAWGAGTPRNPNALGYWTLGHWEAGPSGSEKLVAGGVLILSGMGALHFGGVWWEHWCRQHRRR